MRTSDHRRQILLFLGAILVPSLILVLLSLRIISQERELTEKRLAEERRRWLDKVAEEMLAKLEHIKSEEVIRLTAISGEPSSRPSPNPAVALLARWETNALVLPWEIDPSSENVPHLWNDGEFAAKIAQGQDEEFSGKKLSRAVEAYREALHLARRPVKSACAQLALARALFKLGNHKEANDHYKEVLPLPSDLTDEEQIPISLYGADRLIAAGLEWQSVLTRLRNEIEAQRWRSPGEVYLLRDLVTKLADERPASKPGKQFATH